MSSEFDTKELPRGGVLVRWGDFHLQIGAYPETIKDTMVRKPGVPDLYLVPDELFDLNNGISMAELEFPLYYNYYVNERRLRFICRRHQLRPVVRVLRESIFGPQRLYLESEYANGADSPDFPDLKREFAFYRGAGEHRVKDMVQALIPSDEGKIEVDGVEITLMGKNRFRFRREDEVHEVKFRPYVPPKFGMADARFTPPVFGLTVLGAGHGFDAATSTSGFIIWINRRGILVDPPVLSTDWLRVKGVDARLIEDIILTHCHADHDAGTLQKILQEGRVKVHSTPTVMGSFIRKYRALTGFSEEEFHRLFLFQPLSIGKPIHICSGQFRFHYNFHTIPTLGFEASFQDKTFAYSCDTLYDPEILERMGSEGVMSPARVKKLLNVNWGADVILHEAGVPPIHTPIEVLAELPEQVRDRLLLTHVSPTSVPRSSGLKIAATGLENTLRFEVEAPDLSIAHKYLDILVHTDLFRTLPLTKSLEFLEIVKPLHVREGETVISTGDPGDRFYMLASGEAHVHRDGKVMHRLFKYDYFGEMAVVLNQPRIADVRAATELHLLTMERNDFLKFISDTELPALLRRVSENKMTDAWPVMEANRHLAPLTAFQRNQLMAILKSKEFKPGEELYCIGGLPLQVYLVADGFVTLTDAHGRKLRVGRGALLGRIPEEGQLVTHQTTASAYDECRVFFASLKDLQGFFESNPGTFVRIQRGLRASPFSTTG